MYRSLLCCLGAFGGKPRVWPAAKPYDLDPRIPVAATIGVGVDSFTRILSLCYEYFALQHLKCFYCYHQSDPNDGEDHSTEPREAQREISSGGHLKLINFHNDYYQTALWTRTCNRQPKGKRVYCAELNISNIYYFIIIADKQTLRI